MSNKKTRLDAVKLRLILIGLIVLMLLVFVGGVYGALSYLGSYAKEVNAVIVKADESNDEVDRIQQLSQQLNKDRAAFNNAKEVVAQSKSYKYQNTIIDDVQNMAARSGVAITSFDFTSDAAAAASTTTSSTTSQATPATSGGLRTSTATITVAGPVEYDKMLNFMHSIEQNLTKMQIKSTSFARDAKAPTLLGSQQITIEVYIE